MQVQHNQIVEIHYVWFRCSRCQRAWPLLNGKRGKRSGKVACGYSVPRHSVTVPLRGLPSRWPGASIPVVELVIILFSTSSSQHTSYTYLWHFYLVFVASVRRQSRFHVRLSLRTLASTKDDHNSYQLAIWIIIIVGYSIVGVGFDQPGTPIPYGNPLVRACVRSQRPSHLLQSLFLAPTQDKQEPAFFVVVQLLPVQGTCNISAFVDEWR